MVKRIISAAVGIVLAIAVLFLANTLIFNFAIAAISVIIVYELLSAYKCLKFKFNCGVSFVFVAAMPFLLEIDNIIYRYILGTACVFLMFIGYILQHKTMKLEKLCYIMMSTLLVSLSLGCLITLRDINETHGICYIILTLAGAWLGDSGAYFVGTFFGKHKLCPEISPKKTIEGAVGGVLTTGLIFGIYGYFYTIFQASRGIEFTTNYIELIIIGMLCSSIGVIGDLTASLIKRENSIKDFGNIMPGHGGLMDRFDSVLFVTPFMAMVLSYFVIFK